MSLSPAQQSAVMTEVRRRWNEERTKEHFEGQDIGPALAAANLLYFEVLEEMFPEEVPFRRFLKEYPVKKEPHS